MIGGVSPELAWTRASRGRKLVRDGADANPGGGCSTLSSGATFELTLTYDVAGTPIVVTESGAFECVY